MKQARRTAPRAYRRKQPAAARGLRLFPIVLAGLPIGVFSAIFFAPVAGGGVTANAAAASSQDREQAYFPICSGPERITCVVDGDTIWYRGEKIRLVGFDTPEVSDPGCGNEARLGARATRRLQELLNAGPFSLSANPSGRATDSYGRSLKVVSRGGRRFGDILIAEGLAERRGGRRNIWC